MVANVLYVSAVSFEFYPYSKILSFDASLNISTAILSLFSNMKIIPRL